MEIELEKYLPVGTVLLLKEGTKRVVITGFCAMGKDHGEVIYDYTGCLYPEGMIDSNKMLMFNHDQIDKIYHLGLIDQEELTFKTKLKEIMEKRSKKIKDSKKAK